MLLPNRHQNTSDYRYGFQGQEMDDEIKGEGNSINYKFRMYDPRVGRFFAVDPLANKYSFQSPYSFAENSVILFNELEGLEAEIKDMGRSTYLIKLKNADFSLIIRKSNERLTDAMKAQNSSNSQEISINTQMFDVVKGYDYNKGLKVPQPQEGYIPQGKNIVQGKNKKGRSSPSTFYFSQASDCTWSCGMGDVPSDANFGIGGGMPLIINGLKYGVENILKNDAPANIKVPERGPVNENDYQYLNQKSSRGINAIVNHKYSLFGYERKIGKTVLGYNSKENTWAIVSQQNGNSGFLIKDIIDAMASMGYDNVLLFDSASSATLVNDSKTLTNPDDYKDFTMPAGIIITVPNEEK